MIVMADVRDSLVTEAATFTELAATLPQPPHGFGTDLVAFDDLDSRLAEVDPSGLEGLRQDTYHRVTTARGTVADAPDYGIDVRDFLHRASTAAEFERSKGEAVQEIEKDDRIDVATVDLTREADRSLTITIRATPVDPELEDFELVLAVSSGGVLLEAVG